MKHLDGVPRISQNQEVIVTAGKEYLVIRAGLFGRTFRIPRQDVLGIDYRVVEKNELDGLSASLFAGVAIFTAPLMAPLALLFKRNKRIPVVTLAYRVNGMVLNAHFTDNNEKRIAWEYKQILSALAR